jgi:hypothetical protein
MHTNPDGTKKKDAPPSWPFGTVKPPTKKQLQQQVINESEPALL